MTELSRYEQETIINYNQEEQLASCYTHDKALIRRLNKLMLKNKDITLVRAGQNSSEYSFPKRWVKIVPPKELSEETRAKMANMARERFAKYRGGENS